MTYNESLRDIQTPAHSRSALPRTYASFFNGTQQALDKECAFYEKKLFSANLSIEAKIALMDYIERLQFASDLIRTKDSPVADLRRAARHLGKKMQSSVFD
jgi:hypothetical protein